MLPVTKNQFNNILKFLVIWSVDDRILKSSPAYILEKFEKFVSPTSQISDEEITYGVHPTLQRDLINPYMELWKPEFKNN